MVSLETGLSGSGELLNTFVTHNRSRFPLLVRVTDWKEETSILENHLVRPGVQLVVHGWTRQTKVLAKAGALFYAVPLTYGGQFRVRSKTFNGAVQLWNARPKSCLRVVRPDLQDPTLLAVDDILRLKRPHNDEDDDDEEGYPDGDRRRFVRETKKFLRCEKLHPDSGKSTDFRIPLTCSARFEEVLEDFPANPDLVHIRELVQTLNCRDVEVELVSPSPDRPARDRDLPERTSILLSDNVTEQAVYVSVETPTAPAFHLPLRTLVYVAVVRGLDKRCSPLLTKQAPKLSTLDRCVEILPPDVFDSLRPSQRSFESPDFVAEESRPVIKVMATPAPIAQYDASSDDSRTSAGYPGSLSFSIKGSNVHQKHSTNPVPSSILPKHGSVQHPVAYFEHSPGPHGESQHSLSPPPFRDSGRIHSVSVELPRTTSPYSGQLHPTALQNQSLILSEGHRNYLTQTVQSQAQLNHPQTQTIQPQNQILQTQTQMLQPQTQIIQPQLHYTHQPQMQAVQSEGLVQQPQFQTLEPQSQTFLPNVEFNQSQIQNIPSQSQFAHSFTQQLQPQPQMSQVFQPSMQVAQSQLQMAQPQLQMTQQLQHIAQPQMHVSHTQLQLAQPHMQLGQPHLQLGQPSMQGIQPQSQIGLQQMAIAQLNLQKAQPQLQLAQPQMQRGESQMQQLSQPQMQWTHMQLSQPQIQLAQPQMQLTQPQAQTTQPYQPVQFETQLTSISTLTGPHPVFKKKGRAPTIPQALNTQVHSPAPSFRTSIQDVIQPANQTGPQQPLPVTQYPQPGQWSDATSSVESTRWPPGNQDVDHVQRTQQQQQPEYSTNVPPGFGLVPLQSANGFVVPPGFALVPISSASRSGLSTPQPPSTNPKQVKFIHPGDDDDDDSDDDVKPGTEVVAKKVAGFKLKIPDDGNLYELSSKRFAELLTYLRIEPETMKTLKKTSVDGKKFAGLSEEDLLQRNLVNPVLMHFRRLTEKQPRKSFVL